MTPSISEAAKNEPRLVVELIGATRLVPSRVAVRVASVVREPVAAAAE